MFDVQGERLRRDINIISEWNIDIVRICNLASIVFYGNIIVE